MPQYSTLPLSALYMLHISLAIVVLPLPDSPTMPRDEPEAIFNETLLSAAKYSFLRKKLDDV